MGFNPISVVSNAAHSVAHAAGSGAYAVSHVASSAAHTVAHAARSGARAVGHAATSTADAVAHTATTAARAVGHGAIVTVQEAAEWGKTAAQTVAHTASQVAATVTNNHKTGNDPVARAARSDAVMAADVYLDKAGELPTGTRVADAQDLARLGVTPQMLESGNFRARLYVSGSGTDTHYTVSFRGTRFPEAADWKSNAAQAVGQPSEHYQKALALGRQLASHPELSISMTGHSLGGGLASAAAIAAGRDANTFNAAGLSDATIQSARAINAASETRRDARVEAFYVRGDVLSAMQDGGDRMAGALLGGAIGGPLGRLVGAALVDAPEAYGTRHAIGNDRPAGNSWTEELPGYRAIARHGMDYVVHNLPQ